MLGGRIKEFLKDREKKQLCENFISLSLLQGANYILPLVILPYLVRVLGPEKFGLIAFARSFVQYFNILTDYGFNLSATREISIYRESKERISEIFSAVLTIKLVLLIFSLVILTIIVFGFQKFRKDWEIYYFSFGIVVGQVLFPVWFFQGMERMKYITILNVIAKLIFAVSIFVFVREVSDYIYVPLINSLGFIVAGILALWIAFKDFDIYFKVPNLMVIKRQIEEGWHIFMSTVSYNLYTNSPKFFIGILINNKSVAFFSLAEKVVNILRQLINIIFQVFYPYLARMFKESFKTYTKEWFRLFRISTGISMLLCAFVVFIPKSMFLFVFSESFLPSLSMLKLLVLSLPLQCFMNLFGMQSMLILGFVRAYGFSYVFFSILFLVILPIILWFSKSVFLLIGLILVTEFMIIIYRIFYLYKKGILYALFRYSAYSRK
ncbi:oligosaccharide flippase family protein [Thermosulfurimonas dismutans]|uniref:Transporter n=1 Tax=Thermosulfurimonas dismutans TaxID=999894 RepID=A0A179D2A4_9BACT|nr:oligosaccharide flippase family protein [Thermosulfurimonas dismutans]OAQ19839.1 transporter [Thermosulfurimonas dismutans]